MSSPILTQLFAQQESFSLPQKALDEELDELLFMVIDLDTSIMGFAEAILSGDQPPFSLDAHHAEKVFSSLQGLDSLSGTDIQCQQQLHVYLQGLIQLRDFLIAHHSTS